MLADQNKRALLLEAVIAGGLIVIGIPAGQPLLALAASVGGNWAHSLAERGFQHWRDRWFTDDGVLNQDIAKALCHAFVDAVRQVEHDWKQHRYYQYLRHNSPEQAQLTLDTLRILREDGATLFQQPDQLPQVAQQQHHDRVLSLLDQDESKANEHLKSVLAAFLYGHDDEFVTFITEQLGPQWILRFLEILKDPDEEGTRAWRACQLLWQKSLMRGIQQIQQTTAETADTVRWLQAWAQHLKSQPPTQRDSTGQDALETILHGVHAQLDEMQKTLNKTYDTTLDIKATLAQVYQKVAPGEIAPTVWNVPYQRNPFFTGREELLKQLHENFTNRKAVALTQAIRGLGGIGKTQTAVEYAYRYRDEYHDVLWVNAATRDTLIASFLDLARLLNLTEKDEQDQKITVQAMKRWLEQHDHWLLIVDNADELSLAYDFLPTGGKGHILLTTRIQAVSKIAQPLEVESWNPETGALFLLRRAGLLAPDAPLQQPSRANRATAREIAAQMGGFPLALDQAGAYLEETGSSLTDYLRLYQECRMQLLQRRGELAEDHPDSLLTTFSLLFRRLDEAEPMAAELLRFCAFLQPDAIPEELVIKGIIKKAKVFNVIRWGYSIEPVASEWLVLDQAVAALRRFSLIKRDSEHQTLSIHHVVQAVLKDTMDKKTYQQWLRRTVRALVDTYRFMIHALSQVTARRERYLTRIFPHAYECAVSLIQRNETFLYAGYLCGEIAAHLGQHTWLDDPEIKRVEQFYLYALDIQEQHLKTELACGGAWACRTSLGYLYEKQGRFEELEPLLQRALARHEQALGAEHSWTTDCLRHLAGFYERWGKYAKMEPFLQRLLTCEEHENGAEDFSTIMQGKSLAKCYCKQRKYTEAEPLLRRVLAYWERQNTELASVNLSIADALYDLTKCCYEQGKYIEATSFGQRAIVIYEQQGRTESCEYLRQVIQKDEIV